MTKYADNFLGAQHDFKVGVQYNSGGGESLNGYNDYIYTYGSTPAYGYTQDPFWRGGRLRAHGRVCGRHRARGPRHLQRRRALRLQQGLLQLVPAARPQRERGRPVQGRGQAVRLERVLAASRRHGQAERGRHHAAQGQCRALLPRHGDGRVRQRHAVDRAALHLRRHLHRGGRAHRHLAGERQLADPDRSGVREPVHRPVHRELRAPALEPHRRGRERRLQEERQPVGLARHRRHLRQRAAHGRRQDLRPASSSRAARPAVSSSSPILATCRAPTRACTSR